MSAPEMIDVVDATALPKHAIKVLLVDDQAIIGEAIRRMLAPEKDIVFQFCNDPTAALHVANKFAPTVILQDLVMPDIDGLMLVRFFRANTATRDIPLIVLSTKEEPKIKAEAFALGANDYVVKLPDKLELLARIRYHSKGYISRLERNDAYKALEQMAKELQLHNRFIRKTFGRYLTDDVVKSLLESPEGLKLGGERRKVTLMMTDLRGFTSMSGRLAPEQVVAMLNRYLGTMVEVIQQYQGTIDEFIGDAIFILFGAPVQRDDDAERAVACAMAMQLAMAGVNAQNRAEGLPEVEMGIGIHTGEVVVGNIGSDRRTKYGVVGSHVNLTARIESYTVGGQVLISDAGRLARLGAGALAGRTSVRLGATWTTLVIAQVAFSVGVLPLAAELAWGTLRTGVVGPGFAAEEYATARVALEGGRFELDGNEAPRQMASEPDAARRQRAVLFGNHQRELTRRLLADPGIVGVAAALRPPGEEPWVFVDIEGRAAPTEALNGRLPGFLARFNQVDTAFFDIYQVPGLAGRRFTEGDVAAEADAVIVNRNFAETIAPGGNALGRRFRYVRATGSEWPHDLERDVAAGPRVAGRKRTVGTKSSVSSAICP